MLLPQGAKLKIWGPDQITLKLCIPSFKVLHSSKDLNFLSPKLWGTNVHLYPPMGGSDMKAVHAGCGSLSTFQVEPAVVVVVVVS